MGKKILECLTICVLFCYIVVSGSVNAYAAEKVASMGGIAEYRLKNGLKVLLFPDASKSVITVNMTYLVGSRHEGYGETGMAHLLEHLMFKGSKNYPDINGELAKRGGIVNGSTWLDRTNYFEIIPASSEDLSWTLKMEADRMVNSFIAKKDLDSEMTVVRNELEMGENDSTAILMERIIASSYLWHNYGKSTIGVKSDLENVPIERLKNFYEKYYQPDNAVLVISGKFDEKNALELVEQYFGKIKKPKRTLFETYTVEPPQDGERTVVLKRTGSTKSLGVAYHIPAAAHPDNAAIEVLTAILSDMPSGKLYKNLVETGKATSVTAMPVQTKEPGLITLTVNLSMEQDLSEARSELLKTIDEAGKNLPSNEELERARKKLLNTMDNNINNPEIMAIEMSEWVSKGDWRLFFLRRQQLETVTGEDVMRVARKYLVAENRTIGELVPTDSSASVEIPQAPDNSKEIAALKKNDQITQGEPFDVSYENIDARTIFPERIGGLQLALLPKKTRAEMVQVRMKFNFGNEEKLKNRMVAGMLTNYMLIRGTNNYSRQQIEDILTNTNASLDVSGNATFVQTNIMVPRENLLKVLRLSSEILRQPAFSDAELAQLKQEVIADIEERKTNPQVAAMDLALRSMAPYDKDDVRYIMDYDEEIKAIEAVTIDDVKNFYQDFYDASFGEISMVGDFDAQEVTAQIKDSFGDWQDKRTYTEINKDFINIKPSSLTLGIPDKDNAMFIAITPIKMTKENSDYPALFLVDYLFGGGFLNSRLANRIRNNDGLSYDVASSLVVDQKNDFGSFYAYAISAPQNIEKVERAFKEELSKALADGFTDEEIKKAKEAISQFLKLQRSMDEQIVVSLQENLHNNQKFAQTAQLEEKIMALTPKQVKDVMSRYIDINNFTIVKAGSLEQK
ncbi:MAG: M16 family metallopeptidase [Acidaminococcaceae bacterium]